MQAQVVNEVFIGLCIGIALIGSWGCSIADTSARGGGGATGGSTSMGGSTSQCNTLANDGSHVVPVHQPTAPPPALGGTIVDGRYTLTAYTLFDGPTGQPQNLGDFWASDVIEITGGVMQSIEGYQMEGVEHLPGTARSYTFVLSGTALNLMETCPMRTASQRVDFTATENEFRQYARGNASVAELIFSKR